MFMSFSNIKLLAPVKFTNVCTNVAPFKAYIFSDFTFFLTMPSPFNNGKLNWWDSTDNLVLRGFGVANQGIVVQFTSGHIKQHIPNLIKLKIYSVTLMLT